ncbi:MAG TPA: hypothetical protein VMF89_10445, partial [Polyangiales bacterium]|nr:hypothetical protein [Polyangiales bacterium]
MTIRSRLCVLTLCLGACRSEAVHGPPAPRGSAAAPARAASLSKLDTARALALTKPSGTGHLDRKLQRLTTVAAAQPRRLTTWIELGRAWVLKARESNDSGYYLNAEACADLALELAPGDALAMDLRSLVLLNAHRFAEAKQLSQALLEQRPESIMALGSLSDALLELGEHEGAELAAARMLDLKPNLPSYSRNSYLRWLRGDTEAARELARLAIDAGTDPREPEARAWAIVQAAWLFWHAGDLEGADAGFAEALRGLPDYPPALVGRARVLLASATPSAAVELLERARARSPLVETTWLLGQAKDQAGDAAGAERAYLDAEREGKLHDPRTLSLMFSTLNRNGESALALAERERRTRGDIYTEDALAFALYRAQRYPEARAAIARARRLGTP